MSNPQDDDDTTAARRLRLLQAELHQPQRRGPDAGRVTGTAEPTAPIHLGVLDHIRASVSEVERYTRAEAPKAGPLPPEAGAVYDWMREHTAHLDEQRRQAREALIYRQGLEHAIRAGNVSVVRRHPCPACGTLGLFWRAAAQRAACVNRYCLDHNSLSHSWTLAYLAQQHVARKERASRRAT